MSTARLLPSGRAPLITVRRPTIIRWPRRSQLRLLREYPSPGRTTVGLNAETWPGGRVWFLSLLPLGVEWPDVADVRCAAEVVRSGSAAGLAFVDAGDARRFAFWMIDRVSDIQVNGEDWN